MCVYIYIYVCICMYVYVYVCVTCVHIDAYTLYTSSGYRILYHIRNYIYIYIYNVNILILKTIF